MTDKIKSGIWVVSYNQDYNESAKSFADPRESVIDMASRLGIPHVLQERGADAEFWMEISEAYENDGWKGLSVYHVDPDSLETTQKHPEDLHFTLEELREIDAFEDNETPNSEGN